MGWMSQVGGGDILVRYRKHLSCIFHAFSGRM